MSVDNNIPLRKGVDKKKDLFPVSWKTENYNKLKIFIKEIVDEQNSGDSNLRALCLACNYTLNIYGLND